MKPVIAHDYLLDPAAHPAKPVCVVYGNDPFLRSTAIRRIRDQVLAGEDAEFSLCHFETGDVSFKNVLKELQTVAMFGGGRRVVRIDDADKFIDKEKEHLENYLAKPSEQSVLVLQLAKSFDARTKFYKNMATLGLVIVADAIPRKDAPQWLVKWSKHQHKTLCNPAAAEIIVERIGAEHGEKFKGTNEGTCGLLDQELAKLSLMVTDAKKGITVELVEQSVGSWRSRTAFDMLNLALDGKTSEAIKQLNALIWAGETVEGIIAPLLSTLQKLATATELVLDAERRNSKISVRSALEKAGVKYYLDETEKRLRTLGRHRGAKLAKWLLQLALDLRGDSGTDERVLLERFIVTISQTRVSP